MTLRYAGRLQVVRVVKGRVPRPSRRGGDDIRFVFIVANEIASIYAFGVPPACELPQREGGAPHVANGDDPHDVVQAPDREGVGGAAYQLPCLPARRMLCNDQVCLSLWLV